jgi:heat shock protein HtpX
MNQVKTTVLLAAMTGLFLWIGHLWGGTQGLWIALVLAAGMNVLTYFMSDVIVLSIYRAHPADEHERLTQVVRRLSEKTGIPMPRVYRIPSATPNAFATGRNPRHAAVAATDGILDLLTDAELEAVMAHELGHVRNRDILISTVVATVAGAISMLASFIRWMAIFGGYSTRRSDERDGGNALGLLIMALLAPIIALLLQLAISRSREYQADESGAKLTGDPLALASALRKIHRGVQAAPMEPTPGRNVTAHLFIENPLHVEGLINLFSTHPPIEKRIARLEGMSH